MKIRDEKEIIETRNWKFNKRNINKIAYEYDAKLINWKPDIYYATLKDSRGRLLWVTKY